MEIRSPRVNCVARCLTYSIYNATGRRTGFSRPSSNEICGCGGIGRPVDATSSSIVARLCTHNRGLARPGQGYPTPSSKGRVLVSRLDSLGPRVPTAVAQFLRSHDPLGRVSLVPRTSFVEATPRLGAIRSASTSTADCALSIFQ